MWDLVTRDYSKWLSAADVVNNVKRYARNGSIITFHDSLKSIDSFAQHFQNRCNGLKTKVMNLKSSLMTLPKPFNHTFLYGIKLLQY